MRSEPELPSWTSSIKIFRSFPIVSSISSIRTPDTRCLQVGVKTPSICWNAILIWIYLELEPDSGITWSEQTELWRRLMDCQARHGATEFAILLWIYSYGKIWIGGRTISSPCRKERIRHPLISPVVQGGSGERHRRWVAAESGGGSWILGLRRCASLVGY